MAVFRPEAATEVADLVRSKRGANLQIAGTMPWAPETDKTVITTENLSGGIRFEPRDFTITASAGTRLTEIAKQLRSKGQQLNFEPPAADPETTIGAIAATNASGPRRPFSGSARDALLGAKFVTGLGEIVSAGSRVLKSVAGLDLTRLLAGSCGNLGLLTEVTFRTRPRQEVEKTLILPGVQPSEFPRLAADILREGLPVSGAAYLSAPLARRTIGLAEPVALIRIEGGEGVLAVDLKTVTGEIDLLPGDGDENLWRRIGEARELFPTASGALWRITCPISQGGMLAARLQALGAVTLIDWRGAKVWAWHEDPAAAPVVLQILAGAPSTHARLISGPNCAAPIRRLSMGQMRFEHAIKQALDPDTTFDTKPYLQGFAGGG